MSPLSALPSSLRHSLSIVSLPLCVCLAAGAWACSRAEGSGDALLIVQVSSDEITVENGTGTPLVKGEVSIIPDGRPDGRTPRPFTMMVPRLSSGEKHSFRLTSFRNAEGIRFIGDAAKGRVVKVIARDDSGRLYEREVPFQ